jgi:Niemann-Pick C1 protein
MGFMHFWGLTIDVVSSIIVIISIGLCVDYSAHIAHTFLTMKGKTLV